jgi:hypothetical protein
VIVLFCLAMNAGHLPQPGMGTNQFIDRLPFSFLCHRPIVPAPGGRTTLEYLARLARNAPATINLSRLNFPYHLSAELCRCAVQQKADDVQRMAIEGTLYPCMLGLHNRAKWTSIEG